MKKLLLLSAITLTGSLLHFNATAQQNNSHIIDADKFTEQQFNALEKNVPNDGWVQMNYQGKSYLLNCSNKDYRMNVGLNCAEGNPVFVIEYTGSYRDGDYEGIDFASSRNQSYADLKVLVDGKSFGNPFSDKGKANAGPFIEALKKGSKLTMSFYNTEFNPETGKDELKLNRSIDFKTAHPELLDVKVDCNS
ncbi:hypothetical protein [Edaphocola aurantiacus]|uniref:hypothetical protein n=1 Tax=Edaphocola aurantiacus TaxID=2601682 RepID=UPI001C93EB2E|nr:hypothetical protein [Edaphocola aurantiacus]